MSVREEFEAWWGNRRNLFSCREVAHDAWQAAYAEGRRAGLEEAAKVCEEHPAEFGFKPKVAASIRALADA